jgi:putative membrane protein
MHDWMPVMGWWFGPVFMIVFWVLLILAVVVVVKWVMSQGSRGSGPPETESALEILKKRYARGEINKQEFEETRRDLL